MASREPNSLRLPATSSSKLSGASTLTIEVSVCAHSAKDSRLCRSRGGDRSNTCKEAASAMAVLELRSRSDAGLDCRTARGDDVQLPSLGNCSVRCSTAASLPASASTTTAGRAESAAERHSNARLGKHTAIQSCGLLGSRPAVAARSLDGARSEQVERLQNARHDRSLARSLPRRAAASSAKRASYIDDARPPASTFEDLHARRRVRLRLRLHLRQNDSQRGRRALQTRTRRPKQQNPAPLILGGELQAPQNDVGNCDPGQHARARPRAHDLLDRPQPALLARRGMNHQQAIDVDAVLLQSRGIGDERRSNPSDPLLGLGRIFFRQCRQCRHQQRELADPVTVDEYLR